MDAASRLQVNTFLNLLELFMVKPSFVFFVKLLEVINCNSLFFWASPLGHAFGARFGICTQIDKSVQLQLSERIEQIGRPVLVDCPLRFRHKSRFEAVTGKNISSDKQVKTVFRISQKYAKTFFNFYASGKDITFAGGWFL